MGGSGNLLLPVGERRMSSWTAHQHRIPRSQEPGTDFYCPIGTPVLAPEDGVIYGSGNSIVPPTGRWVGIQLQSGMSFRAMHFSRVVRTSGVVRRGDIIGYSGASGYGVEDWSSNPNTGGAHTHVTLWPTAVRRFGYSPVTGKPYTIDFMNFVGGPQLGGNVAPAPIIQEEGNDMSFAMGVVDDPTRTPVELVVGYRPNVLTVEEFENYYAGRAVKCSARQYDVNLARHSRLTPLHGAAFLGRGQSENRPWTLFSPGYVFSYPLGVSGDELRANQPFTAVQTVGNDRQFDLWVIQALTGQLPKIGVDSNTSTATLSDDEISRIATAAREAFRNDPLK